MSSTPDETRHGVDLTTLDQPLFGGADASKRELVDGLDAVADRLVPVLTGRAVKCHSALVLAARPEHMTHLVLERLGEADPWAEQMPGPQDLPADLAAEGAE